MSAPAIKSSLPGVGASMQAPPPATHSILPMNMMAQKVVPTNHIGSESNPMKPLSGSSISYVTLQPASQPLSLVQDHRQTFQPPQVTRLPEKEKESETEKPVPNGVDPPPKPVTTDEGDSSKKQNESNQSQNNNLSPENLTQSQVVPDTASEPEVALTDGPGLYTGVQNNVEEKKTTLNNGSKEHEGIPASNVTPLTKTHTEEVESNQRSNTATSVQSSKPPTDVAPITTTPPKSDIKVATPPRSSKRKSRELKDLKGAVVMSDANGKPKRNRIRTQPYQSPLPEIALIVKTLNKAPSSKAPDDKLIVFYKNEFLAVRNAEGSFYVCQAMQNIYKSSRRIRIRWLSQDKNNGEIYSPDFYDFTDFDCILTNLNMNKIDKNKYQLTKIELLRTENILKRAIDVEAGVSEKPRVTEEHPDGLDLSLYKDESQLQKRRKGSKQKQRKKYKTASSDSEDSSEDDEVDKRESVKQAKTKKRPPGKTAVIAKSVGKGTSSRAERAITRGAKTATAVVTATPDASKKSVDTKKTDVRKVIAKPQNNNTTALPKTSKSRSTAQTTVENTASTVGRPKRSAASAGAPIVSTSEPTPRKMPRSRA